MSWVLDKLLTEATEASEEPTVSVVNTGVTGIVAATAGVTETVAATVGKEVAVV